MNLRLYISLLFLSLFSAIFAVTLPSSPFSSANELYEDCQDNISMLSGVSIGRINIQLQTENNPWGQECAGRGNSGACEDCCGEQLLENGTSIETLIYHQYCLDSCGGSDNPSLAPLGSTLWLLPFILVYAGIKRISIRRKQSYE
jgi:hypothetical protein